MVEIKRNFSLLGACSLPWALWVCIQSSAPCVHGLWWCAYIPWALVVHSSGVYPGLCSLGSDVQSGVPCACGLVYTGCVQSGVYTQGFGDAYSLGSMV